MARIQHYEFGRIVVDGQEERRDLGYLPAFTICTVVPNARGSAIPLGRTPLAHNPSSARTGGQRSRHGAAAS
jgi:hypothetical protein